MQKRITLTIALCCIGVLLSSCTTYRNWTYASHPNVIYDDAKLCVPWQLKRVLNRVAERYGKVQVTSTNRWWLENWWKGGAWGSYHLDCEAVDFKVRGNPRSVSRFILSHKDVGGFKHYGGFYHIDTGPRRSW